MVYHVSSDKGKQTYPDTAAFQAALRTGEISKEMLYWHKGMTEWDSISNRSDNQVTQEVEKSRPQSSWRAWAVKIILFLVVFLPILADKGLAGGAVQIFAGLIAGGIAILILLFVDKLRKPNNERTS